MYDFFISYRRTQEGIMSSNLIRKVFEDYGKSVFIDVNEIGVGQWKKQINNAISTCANFVIVVTTDCFKVKEGFDHFFDEIEMALKMQKVITPIIFSGNISKNSLPENLWGIRDFQSIVYNAFYNDAFVDKLIKHFKLNLKETSVEQKTAEESSKEEYDDAVFRREYLLSLYGKL